MANTVTPLQVTAAAGILQNQGLAVNAPFAASLAAYNNTVLITKLRAAMALGGAYPGLFTIGATTFPALGSSVPAGTGASTSSSGFISATIALASKYMGGGDLSKFAQAQSICQGYADVMNPYVNGAVNSQSYLATTFTNTNNMVTGDITTVTTGITAFANDLLNLGSLINLERLDELGSPMALVNQIAKVGGLTPAATLVFSQNGVPYEVAANFSDPTLTTTDTVQKLMYIAMTKITGTTLAEILQILNVKTANINTMADLLNPYKIFPNSFQTLIVTNKNGVSEKIYIDSQGTVNQAVAAGLPSAVTNVLS